MACLVVAFHQPLATPGAHNKMLGQGARGLCNIIWTRKVHDDINENLQMKLQTKSNGIP
jgi:hypothetical protein